jgi:ABC-type bacteriocin/lantibiotic exporter with double-glycine peptidase domain
MLAAASLGQVAPYQQIEKYSCGAATLKSVLGHWGEHVRERTLIKEIGIDPENGSTAIQVADAAHRRGYNAAVKMFGSIAELGHVTAQDTPVILAIRSFTRPNQGHFVVATAVKPTTVEIMDPNVKGNRRTLSHSELNARWKFRDRVGVVVTPKNKHAQLGTVSWTSRTTAFAIVGAVLAVAGAVTGYVLWRRKHAS